jgi:hypothetical protein
MYLHIGSKSHGVPAYSRHCNVQWARFGRHDDFGVRRLMMLVGAVDDLNFQQ